MKVRIISCHNSDTWYYNNIGCIFEVEPAGSGYYRLVGEQYKPDLFLWGEDIELHRDPARK